MVPPGAHPSATRRLHRVTRAQYRDAMMRLRWVPVVCVVAACASTHPAGPTAPAASTDAGGHVAHVESDLLPAVRVEGEARGRTLAARMREYRIPALSIAVVNNYRIEWAKAYGV